MYDFSRLRIAIVPTRRDSFPPPGPARAAKAAIMKRLDALLSAMPGVETVNVDALNEEGMLFDAADTQRALDIVGRVDALILPHANFGQEEAVARLARRLMVPTLLWGPRDERPPHPDVCGVRQTDTQCGLFATGKALASYGVPFTYIENCWLDSPVLDRGVQSFVRTASAVRAFRDARVLQLSTRPRQFLSVKVNESELLSKFGIEVTPVESSEILSTVRGIMDKESAEVNARVSEWSARLDTSRTGADQLTAMAAVEMGIERLADRYGCTVAAGECWAMFRQAFGIRVCFVYGDLTQRGLPLSCETDIHGAITSALAMGVARGQLPTFLADITIRHPDDDNAELLWHCGPFPSSLARPGANPAIIDCHGAWEIMGGDLTVVRFDAGEGGYVLFADEGVSTEGPVTDGNYVWLKTPDWPRWERKFVCGPYIHHVVGAHGKYAAALHEACKYLGDVTPDWATFK